MQKPKQTVKTNLYWPPEFRNMKKTYSWLENNFNISKFHLENGNLKKLSRKHFNTAKTSLFSPPLLLMDERAHFSMSFDFLKIRILKEKDIETIN